MNTKKQLALFEEIMKRQELLNIIEKSTAQNIKPLFFKGTALAYSIYSSPVLRQRLDHDLLVPEWQVESFIKILTENGYTEYQQLKIFNERCFYKTDEHGVHHVWDIHWKISNRAVVSDLYTYEELYSRSIQTNLPGLLRIGNCDHIFITALHEVMHHKSEFNKTALTDGLNLFRQLNSNDLRQLFLLAKQKKLTSLLEEFSSKIEKEFQIRLPHGKVDPSEKTSNWISPPINAGYILIQDFWWTKGLKNKIFFIKNLAFPDRQYLIFHRTSWLKRLISWLTPIQQKRKVG